MKNLKFWYAEVLNHFTYEWIQTNSCNYNVLIFFWWDAYHWVNFQCRERGKNKICYFGIASQMWFECVCNCCKVWNAGGFLLLVMILKHYG